MQHKKEKRMKYEEACDLLKNKQDLIGTRTEKGITISQLIIVPSDEEQRKLFFDMSLWNKNFAGAILRYKDCDVEVWGIDLSYYIEKKVLFYKKIES